MIKSNIFLEKEGKFNEDINKYVLSKHNALKYIELLFQEEKIIAGGDVLGFDNKGFYYIYDNWYLEDNALNVQESYIYTKSYIQNYLNDNLVYFDIVLL